MRISNIILLPLFALLGGCSTLRQESRFGVLAHEPHEFMFVSGDGQKEWYSALELDQIARRYADENNLTFDFAKAGRMVWVNTDGGKVLADVHYSSGFGEPSLHVAIGRHGQVIHYKIGTSVCGTGSK